MKRKTLVVLMTIAMAIFMAANAYADGPKAACTLEKAVGDYAAQGAGKFEGADAINIGTYHLDKDGTATAHVWINIGGALFLEVDRVGQLTLNPDCTATQVWNDGGPLAKCVFLDDSNEIWCVYDQPAYMTANLKRIHRRD